MPKYKLTIQHVDTYELDIEVEGETRQEAIDATERILTHEGWDSVAGDEDGEYVSCESSVKTGACPHDNVMSYTEDGVRYRACRDCEEILVVV